MVIGREERAEAPQGQRAADIWPEFLRAGVKTQRSPPVSRGSYTTLKTSLGLHPEDEDGESLCLLRHGAMPQQSLHQAARSHSREICIADERLHPSHLYPRQDPGHQPATLTRWQQTETWSAAPTQIVQDKELQVAHLLIPRDISSPALQPPPTPSFYLSSFFYFPSREIMLAFR